MIKDRYPFHSEMEFTKLDQAMMPKSEVLIVKQGASYLSELLYESNRLGLVGKRLTDIIVSHELNEEKVIVEFWTVPFRREDGKVRK